MRDLRTMSKDDLDNLNNAMKATLQLTLEDGTKIKRTGSVTQLQELTNPTTGKAYGFNVSLIFNDFQPAAFARKEPTK